MAIPTLFHDSIPLRFVDDYGSETGADITTHGSVTFVAQDGSRVYISDENMSKVVKVWSAMNGKS